MRRKQAGYLPILIAVLTLAGPAQTVTAAELTTTDDVKTDKKLRLKNDGRSDLQELTQRIATGDTGDGQPAAAEPNKPDTLETPEVTEPEQPNETDPPAEQPALPTTDNKPPTSGKAPRSITTNTNGSSTWTFDSDTGLLVFSAGQLSQRIDTNLAENSLTASQVKKIQFNGDEGKVTVDPSVPHLFDNLDQLTDFIDLQNFDTTNATSMSYWFTNTKGLTNPDLSSLNTSNVLYMTEMFHDSGVTNLDLSNWNVNQVTTFQDMFFWADKLTTLNLSTWGADRTVDSVNMGAMFSNASALTNLDLTNFKTKNVTNMSSMFRNTGLISLNLSTWDVTKVKEFQYMFYSSAALANLNLSDWGIARIADSIYMNYMFYNTSALTNLNLMNFKTKNVTGMSYMFYGSGITNLDLSNWNVDQVTTFNCMFAEAKHLTTLDLSNWGVARTADSVNMTYMFSNTSALTTLKLTNFKTTNVTTMAYMFRGTGITHLDLSDWNVNQVTTFDNMFAEAKNLTTLNLSNWGVGRTADTIIMRYMFFNASALTTLNLTDFKTTNVTNMARMFVGTGLAELDLSHWDVSKGTKFFNMFYNASKLKTLDLSGWYTSGADVTAMFGKTTSLWKITLSANMKFTGSPMFWSAPAIGTTISDNGQNYKTTAASWQIVGNGTDHNPAGNMVTTDQMYADRSETITYVWAQAPTFDGVANLTFDTLGAGAFRNGNKPLASNMSTGAVSLINLDASKSYKVSVAQTSDWNTSGQSAKISKNDLSIQYGQSSLESSVDFWTGTSASSQNNIMFNHNTSNSFSIWLNPNTVIDTKLLGKQLASELTWTLSETPQ
ncbi:MULTISPECIES: BspA family leucine-rich repeat surface protein [Leuconostoc]|uniref:BspA family leucine-rich repeat surface protein n=1 Tax=Leuconostoc TaxID=1243 RepID=UPI0025B2177E|nr:MULTISPECIES: BspA family leucine-rich repeat surface protein [Leuconostoc]MDN2450894.1 BspA family leucine-rich repeat surface protein [Leuconostoc sp. UCMA20149]